jgi:hypothetical protein
MGMNQHEQLADRLSPQAFAGSSDLLCRLRCADFACQADLETKAGVNVLHRLHIMAFTLLIPKVFEVGWPILLCGYRITRILPRPFATYMA